jgi:hypothetical protein
MGERGALYESIEHFEYGVFMYNLRAYGHTFSEILDLGHCKSEMICNLNYFETNDSDITFIKRRFDATACIIFKL